MAVPILHSPPTAVRIGRRRAVPLLVLREAVLQSQLTAVVFYGVPGREFSSRQITELIGAHQMEFPREFGYAPTELIQPSFTHLAPARSMSAPTAASLSLLLQPFC